MTSRSGKELWRLAARGIDPAKTAIAADRVFFYADRSYASCLDLKTGKPIWKTDAPIAKNPLGTGWSFTFMITERVGALASPDVYLINSYKDGHYQAFAAKDGSILWGAGHGRTEQMPPWDEESQTGEDGLSDHGGWEDHGPGRNLLRSPYRKTDRGETADILRRLRFILRLDAWRPRDDGHRL